MYVVQVVVLRIRDTVVNSSVKKNKVMSDEMTMCVDSMPAAERLLDDGRAQKAFRALVTFVCSLIVLHNLSCRWELLAEASRRRFAAEEALLRRARFELERHVRSTSRGRLAFEIKLIQQAEQQQLDKVRKLIRLVDSKQQQAYAARSLAWRRERVGAGTDLLRYTAWHGIAPDGSCPAEVPHWEWSYLLKAAETDDPVVRYEAMAQLGAQSRLARPELLSLVDRYHDILHNVEFKGILNISHPPCGGEQFAHVSRERILHMRCKESPRYWKDDEYEMMPYGGPVHLSRGETVVAFCGSQFNVMSHPMRKPEALARALATPRKALVRQPGLSPHMLS